MEGVMQKMNYGIYVEIDNPESLISFLTEAKKKGLFKNISLNAAVHSIKQKDFPMRFPIRVDGVLDIAANPIIRKVFGKKIEDGAERFLKGARAGG